jgi:hypothetical protein
MWIGLGSYFMIESLTKRSKSTAIALVMLIASIMLVPFNMAYSNIPV